MFKKIGLGLIVIVLILAAYIMRKRIYWKKTDSKTLLEDMDNKFNDSFKERQAILLIENKSGNITHISTSNMKRNDKIMIASITKLYTHALIYVMSDQKLIDLNKKVSDYLPEEYWYGIHKYKDKDNSKDIRVIDLINQTSGLADYEMDIKGENSVIDRLKREDFELTEKDAIEITKNLQAKSLPGEEKAYYSNLNSILLGLIAEEVTHKSLIELYDEYIFTPLGLNNTELISDSNHIIPLLDKEKGKRTKYVSSALACGGLVSTVDDLMYFLKSFYNGKIFNEKNIQEAKFNDIQFFPLKYGKGMISVEMPSYMSPIIDAPQIIGHSGLSASFAFYCPEKELFIVGSLNKYEENPFQWIYQYLNAMKK